MHFVKMHALGNDYVYLDAFRTPALAARRDLPALARAMSDRHRGIGSDGLILIARPTRKGLADVRMRMFNADGSEAEMCGNGVRCVAKFAHDRLGLRRSPIRVQTGRGVLGITYTTRRGALVEAGVDMGEPILGWRRLGVRRSRIAWGDEESLHAGIEAAGTCFAATLVSMGNPHAVIFQDPRARQHDYTPSALQALDLATIGPAIEGHPAFAKRINVHFVSVRSKREATMRTWERGAGSTQACGTGACAVAVAGVLTQRLARRVLLHLPGGDLCIHWDDATNRVIMTGPAQDAFEGEWPDR
jgi:diaminopimelate epimerase